MQCVCMYRYGNTYSFILVAFIGREKISIFQFRIDRRGFHVDLTDAGQPIYAVAILFRSVVVYVCMYA